MKFRHLAAALLALGIGSARADQASLYIPTSGPHSMADLAVNYINPALKSMSGCNYGTSAPTNGTGSGPNLFQCWIDTSSSPNVYKIWDGTTWDVFGLITPGSGSVLVGPASGGLGAASLTGILVGNGSSPATAITPGAGVETAMSYAAGSPNGFAVLDSSGLAPSGYPFVLQYTTFTATASQILNANTSPITVIPGVSGKTIYITNYIYQYNFVTTDYSSGSDAYVGLYYASEPITDNNPIIASFDNQSYYGISGSSFWFSGVTGGTYFAGTPNDVVGSGIIFTTPADTIPTGGDSTVTYKIWYYAY